MLVRTITIRMSSFGTSEASVLLAIFVQLLLRGAVRAFVIAFAFWSKLALPVPFSILVSVLFERDLFALVGLELGGFDEKIFIATMDL